MREPSVRPAIYTLYCVALLDLFAVSLFLPLINREIQHMGGSPFMMGVVSSIYGGIQLFSSPFFGRYSDSYGNKLMIIIAIAVSSFGYILQGSAGTLAALMLARIVVGFFKHTQTLSKVALTNLAPHHKSYVLGNFNAFGSMGFICGPTIGGHLVQYDNGFRNVCYLSSLLFIVNIVLVFMMVPETSLLKPKSTSLEEKDKSPLIHSSKSKENHLNDANANMSSFYIIAVLALRFLFCFATLVPRANLLLIMESKYQASITSVGYLNSLQALVSTITGFCVGPVISKLYKEKHRQMVIHGSIVQLISLVSLSVSPTFRLAGFSLMLLSATNPFLRVGITSLSLEETSDHGTILGFGQTASSLARMLSPVAAGISQEWGSDDSPALLGAIAAFFGVLCVLFCIQAPPSTKLEQKMLRKV